MANPYLQRLQDQYNGLRSGIENLQARAVEENRDLTEEEFRSVQEDTAKAEKLYKEIETLTEFEARSAKVTQLAASLPREPEEPKEKTEVRSVSNTTAIDRDPGHYRSIGEGGRHSFFVDQVRARLHGDEDARRRLEEHTRAVTSAGNPGILPPKWLTDEYMALARQGRVAAARVRHMALGNDPRPIVLPKQTAGANDIPQQTSEGGNAPAGSASFTTGSDTLTPATYVEYFDVPRQLLDASDPSVDALIYTDLRSAWDTKMEALVCNAILTGGTDFNSASPLAWPASGAGNSAIDVVIDAQVAVSEDNRGPADTAIMAYSRFGAFRKLTDANGRPLMPVSRYNPQNANGALGNVLMGDIEGVDALGTSGVPVSATADEKFAVLRADAVILAESTVLDFTYDQVVGPSQVRIGIWGYAGTLVRNPGSVQVITIDTVTA